MLSEMDMKKKEAAIIGDWLEKDDYLVALDERGKMIRTVFSFPINDWFPKRNPG